MSELNIFYIKRLLENTTPGPWVVEDTESPDYITSDKGNIMWNSDQAVDWSANREDVKLAALAPQLAQEVVRLHEKLGKLTEEVFEWSEMCMPSPEEAEGAEDVAYLVNKILAGDTEHSENVYQ